MTEEEQVLALFERSRAAWEARDVDTMIAMNDGAGFGWRARDARTRLVDSPERRKALETALATYEYARVVDVDVQVQVDGDTAILWGFFTEEFQHKDREPETVRVRFTRVARKRDGEWTYAWGHRDAQPFDRA